MNGEVYTETPSPTKHFISSVNQSDVDTHISAGQRVQN